MNKLSKRLSVIASLVNKKNICDVGCDHGKLPKYLLENNMVDSVVISDISQKSLQKAIDLLSDGGYNFDSICCDGLKGYSGKNIEQCVISGLGGQQIIEIISNSPIMINSFILSPQHENIKVKEFILSKGFIIDFDIIILDKGKFYNIFRCEKQKVSDTLTTKNKSPNKLDFNLYFGKANFESPLSDIYAFKKAETVKVENILKNSKEKFWKQYLKLLNKIK